MGCAGIFGIIKNTTDPRVVEELADKTSILIEDDDLRTRMGRAGRQGDEAVEDKSSRD